MKQKNNIQNKEYPAMVYV